MIYARAAYSALPQKSFRITFQPTYANLLSSKITQHDKYAKAGNLTKTFSNQKRIKTNNIFAIRGKKPRLRAVPLQSSLSSAELERANWPRGKLERGGKKRDCILFCNRRVQISPRPQHRRIGLVDKQ